MSVIGIVDYGCGNVRSVAEAFEYLGHETRIAPSPREAGGATHLVLPGVGAFRFASERLRESGLGDAIRAHIGRGLPFLGICVGMQVLMEEGEEFGNHPGLGVIQGRVSHLSSLEDNNLACPHIGWDKVAFAEGSLFRALDGEYFYFNHSYACAPRDAAIVSGAPEGRNWPAMMEKDNIFGVQCHPEKSQIAGLRCLDLFARLPA